MKQINETDQIWLKALSREKIDEIDPIQLEANSLRKAIISRRNSIESEVISSDTYRNIQEQLNKEGFFNKSTNKKTILNLVLSFITGSTITAAASFGIMMQTAGTRSLEIKTDKTTIETNENEYSTRVISIKSNNTLERSELILREALNIDLVVTIQSIEGNYTLKISGIKQTQKNQQDFLNALSPNLVDSSENTIIVNIQK